MKKLILTLSLIALSTSLFTMEEQPAKKHKGCLSRILNFRQNQRELKDIKKELANLKLAAAKTVEEAQAAIKEGADINKKENGRTPLSFALIRCEPQVAEFLINMGADIHSKDENGNSFVTNALHGECYDVARLLIKKGVDVKNVSTLNTAVNSEQIDLVKMILDKGVNINSQNEYGITPLMNAIKQGNLEMVKFLVNNGAEIDIKDKNGKTALDYARQSDNQEIIEFLDNTYRPFLTSKILEVTNLIPDVANIASDYWSSTPEEITI